MRKNINEIPNNTRILHAINYKKINKATNVNLNKDSNKDFIENVVNKMIKTCLNDGGIGFAATQFGILKNIIIVREFNNPQIWNDHTDYFNVYINPTIIPNRNSEKWAFTESCLSVPNKNLEIKRFNEIKINYWALENNNFIPKEEILEGYLSRVLQHENDHLLGMSIIDRFNQQNKK